MLAAFTDPSGEAILGSVDALCTPCWDLLRWLQSVPAPRCPLFDRLNASCRALQDFKEMQGEGPEESETSGLAGET